MTLPATRAVRRAFPGAHLTILVKRELAGFYDGVLCADEVLALPGGSTGERLRFTAQLRRRSFDTALVFPRSFGSALWVALAGVPRRIGWTDGARGWLLTDRHNRSPDVLRRHQVNDHTELVRLGLGVEPNVGDVALSASPRHVASMRRWLGANQRGSGDLIALAVAAAYGPAKEWPAESYAALADRLASRGLRCVLVGSPGDRERCERVAAAAATRPLVAAGRTSVGELVALLSLCDGFVGNDSGATHVASALGIPTVAIFGSTRPWRTGPLGPRSRVVRHPLQCSPCMDRHCRFGHYDCLRSISVERVTRVLLDATREKPAPDLLLEPFTPVARNG